MTMDELAFEKLVADIAWEIAKGHQFQVPDAIEARVRAMLSRHDILPRLEMEDAR
jgi:hypothetical protein